MKYLKRYNEGIDDNSGQDDKISNFIESFNDIMGGEFSPGDEPSNSDLLSEIGDLCNELDMSSDDIKEVIDSGVSDISGLLKIIYDETLQDEVNGVGVDKHEQVLFALSALSDHGKLENWIKNLSEESFDILYNILAGSGEIETNNY